MGIFGFESRKERRECRERRERLEGLTNEELLKRNRDLQSAYRMARDEERKAMNAHAALLQELASMLDIDALSKSRIIGEVAHNMTKLTLMENRASEACELLRNIRDAATDWGLPSLAALQTNTIAVLGGNTSAPKRGRIDLAVQVLTRLTLNERRKVIMACGT